MSDTLQQQMTDYLVDRLGLLPEEIGPKARFKEDMGLDSLDMVELVSLLESHLGTAVADTALEHLTTLQDVVTYLEEHGTNATSEAAA